jgi:hypothetical protein
LLEKRAQARLAFILRARRMEKPTIPKPAIIIAQVDGSGTAAKLMALIQVLQRDPPEPPGWPPAVSLYSRAYSPMTQKSSGLVGSSETAL